MGISVVHRSVAIALFAYAVPVSAQHEGYAMPGAQGAQPGAQQVTACVQSQQRAMTLVDMGHRRLELARQTNEAAALRAAVDDFQTTLSAVKAQLASCAQLAAQAPVADPHAGMVMPNVQAAPGTPVMAPGSPASAPAASPADPHAGMVMPGATAKPASPPSAKPQSASPRATAAAPRAGTPSPAAPADPHAGMVMPGTSAKPATSTATQPVMVEDPVSKTKVDPKTALRASYQGKTYYFRSDKERQEFMKNPAKYIAAK